MKRGGAYSEYLTLPLENLHVVPDVVSDEQAVFVEPLAAACEILEQVDVKKIREAAGLGGGELGQIVALGRRAAVARLGRYGENTRKRGLARRHRGAPT